MQKRFGPILVIVLAVTGCTAPMVDDSAAPGIGNIPEEVAALAAPDQDLTTARFDPEDNCYWYAHSGPVETTLVPLRSTGGNPICAARQS